jgi:hypothetical protein
MAVTDVDETTVRDGSVTGTESDYTRTFRVRVDNRNDQLKSIYLATAGSLPRYLDPHPDNLFASCRKLAAKQATDHWQWWMITADYSSKPLTTEEKEREVENPLQRKAKIRWSRNRYMEPIDKDRKGNAILNSAGDYYDPPPERHASYWVAQVTKNVPSIPTWVLGPDMYDNVVNTATFTIQGRSVLPRCALLVPTGVSEELEENKVKYHELTFEIEFRRPPDIDGGRVLDPKTLKSVTQRGHDLVLLDQGLRVLRSSTASEEPQIVNAKDDDENDVTSPVALDGEGHKHPSPKPDSVFYFAYEVYRPVDFSPIAALLT